MDQPKIERMLRLMQLLSGNINYTLDEMAEKLDLSRRSIFRYIDTFKNAGFVVQRLGDGYYKMTTYDKELADLSQLVYFSEEEAIIVSRLIENLSSTNAMKAGLKQKLAAVYDSTSIADYIQMKSRSDVLETLAKAIQDKKQVALIGYESAVSNQTKDYVVEPYAFTKDYVDIWACDTASGVNKIFKISRIGEVRRLGDWQMEDKHEQKPIDAFRMSGDGHPIEHVKLRLTLRAKDLLTEEFPVTEDEVYQVKRTWYWEGDVNSLQGVGRFVIGLSEEIAVEEGALLKAWLVEKGEKIQKKFSKDETD